MARDQVQSAALLSDTQWQQYLEEGHVRLGKVTEEGEVEALCQRIDDIMLGKATIDYDRMLMQLDSKTGEAFTAGPQTKGHKGATLDYRKIQDLELDPLFLSYMQKPLFREICARAYGKDTPISCFRAMFMNKPAKRGTHLTWHQDVFRDLDGNPTVTIWMAMDRATTENGCVKIIPGSHRSLLDPESRKAFLPDEKVEPYLKQSGFLTLEAGAGEGFLLHNWMIHGSEINKTDHPRRAFSVCFMDAATKSDKGQEFSIIFGEGALEPDLP